MKFKRVMLIVLDSVGVGALPDANAYHDQGSNTIAHIASTVKGLNLPTLESLGFGNLTSIEGVNPYQPKASYFTKCMEKSVGKDTMTGHWEMVGLHITKPFKTFTDTGFPDALIQELETKTNRKIVGNKSASGTEILDELGEHHSRTGDLIVYTSADSVLQIAAHESIIPPEELWSICKIAREITMQEQYKVGRVIARPFTGEGVGAFKRTSNRHDYALKPIGKTVLDSLKEAKFDVISIGKISDIFDTEGITRAISSKSNEDGMNQLLKLMDESFTGLAFLNLVDFDAMYGHRRDPVGYAKCLEEFDLQLAHVLEKSTDEDLIILTADHGNDPTWPGTDHTREYIPLIFTSKQFKLASQLEIGDTFGNIGATIAENFHVENPGLGSSYLSKLN